MCDCVWFVVLYVCGCVCVWYVCSSVWLLVVIYMCVIVYYVWVYVIVVVYVCVSVCSFAHVWFCVCV